jgi:hypothetical protein
MYVHEAGSCIKSPIVVRRQCTPDSSSDGSKQRIYQTVFEVPVLCTGTVTDLRNIEHRAIQAV